MENAVSTFLKMCLLCLW